MREVCASSEKIIYSNPESDVCSVRTTAYDKNSNIFTSVRRKKVQCPA